MSSPPRQTRSRLMQVFQEQGLRPRGDLGQNFLIDLNLLELVVQSARLSKEDLVLEVGTGTGGMTSFLAQEAGYVVSVEYDPQMYALAQDAVVEYDNVTLLNTDALENKNQLSKLLVEEVSWRLGTHSRLKLVANLPYHVGTPVISNLIATEFPWELMVVTVQWELAERMVAQPGTSDYSALSIWLQSQCDLEIVRKLPPSVFWPRPKVDSAIVKIERNLARQQTISNRHEFHELVRGLFVHRRKVLRSALSSARRDLSKPEIDQLLAGENLAAEVRAEELPPEKLVSLSNALTARKPSDSQKNKEDRTGSRPAASDEN